MEESKTFYERAEEFYNLAKTETDFFKKKEKLKKCVDFLSQGYQKREVETLEGLPVESMDILHLSTTETSRLIGKLYDFFLTEKDFPEIISQEQVYQC